MTSSEAQIYDAGYLPSNLDFMRKILNVDLLLNIGERAAKKLFGHEKKRITNALEVIEIYFYDVEMRIEAYLETMKHPL